MGDVAERRANGAPNRQDERRCAYILDEPDNSRPPRFCGAPPRPGSAYCSDHHARCRVRGGSAAERRSLREIEALAAAVGGKQARLARQPSADMLRRLERAAQSAFSRAGRSRIVRGGHHGDATDD